MDSSPPGRSGDSMAAAFVNWVGLSGLVTSFFSIIHAYSRQVFALSRAGYLPLSSCIAAIIWRPTRPKRSSRPLPWPSGNSAEMRRQWRAAPRAIHHCV